MAGIRIRGGDEACTSIYTASEQKRQLRLVEEGVMAKVDSTQRDLMKLPDSDKDKSTHYKKVEDANNCYKKLMRHASNPYQLNHNELTEIWKWFEDKEASIEQIFNSYPVSDFPTESIEDQRKCQILCKNLFTEFRNTFFKEHVVDRDFEDEKTYPVKTSDPTAAAGLLLDMNKALSFEGVPASRGASMSQQKMHIEISEAINTFCDTLIWPEETVSLKSRSRHFTVAKQMKDYSLISKLNDAIDTQKSVFADSNYDDILLDLDYSRQMIDQQEAQIERLKASEDESLARFVGQDSNLDRAFHFLFKLHQAHPEVPSMNMWQQAMRVVKGVSGRIIKQETFLQKLRKTGIPLFRNLNLNAPGDSLRFSKFQHPLLISVKRWCNGAACFSGITSVGQLLNIMHQPGSAMTYLLELDLSLQGEMAYMVLKTPRLNFNHFNYRH